MGQAEITAKVVREAGGVVVIRYTGAWRSRHQRDEGDTKFPIDAAAAGEGIGVYDPATKSLTSLIWVLKGSYRRGPTASVQPTTSVVEWVSEAPREE